MYKINNKSIPMLIAVIMTAHGTGVYAQDKPDYSGAVSVQTNKQELMNSDEIKVRFHDEGETYYSKYIFTKDAEFDYTFIYGISAHSDSELDFKLSIRNAENDELVNSENLIAKTEAQEYDFPDELLEEGKKYYYTAVVTKGNGNGFIHLDWEAKSEQTEAVYNDIAAENEALKRAVITLSDKGIMEGYEDGSFRPDKEITRAELSKLMYKLDNSGSNSENKKYTDVSTDYWAYEYISKSSYFKGYEDGSFRPEENVLVCECLTAAVRAAGLEEKAIETGRNYPHNYITTALSAGLTAGIDAYKSNAPITRGDAALVIYNITNNKSD